MSKSAWWIELESLLKYHESMQLRHGKIKGGPRGNNSGWSIKDTAREAGWSRSKTTIYIQLAKFCREKPETRKLSGITKAIEVMYGGE